MSQITKIISIMGFGKRNDLHAQVAPDVLPNQAPTPPSEQTSIVMRQPEPGKHSAVKNCIDLAISGFLKCDLPQHFQIAQNDAYYLESIEIEPMTEQAQAQLSSFLQEFQAQALRSYVSNQFKGTHSDGVVLNSFSGIHAQSFRAPPSGTTSENATDDFEKEIAKTSETAEVANRSALFSVTLVGSWQVKLSQTVDSKAHEKTNVVNDSEQRAGPKLRVTVWDARDPVSGRSLEFETYPVQLCREHAGTGSDVAAGIAANTVFIAGEFMSAVHATLELDGAEVRLRDVSRNGTWINSNQLSAKKTRALAGGDMVRFASAEDRDPSQYPRLRVDMLGIPSGVAPAGFTPVIAQGNAALVTPISLPTAVAVSPQKVLAQLTVEDASGRKQLDITQLPFTIGRNTNQNYVVPEGNLGVSREHLRITAIKTEGASVDNFANKAHGTGVNPADAQHYGACFDWVFDQEIQLAVAYKKAPAVRMTLRKVN